MDTNNPDITSALDRIYRKTLFYRDFYAYYNGEHQLNFSSEKFKNKFGKRLQSLRQNLCKTVVKAPQGRLEITGFQAESQDIQDKAWEIWKRNKMPLQSGKIHREAFKTGESFAIVWADANGKARIYPQTASNCTIWTDGETGETTLAAKIWIGIDNKIYLTLYYPDRIEKYISKSKDVQNPFTAYPDFNRIQGNYVPNLADFEPRVDGDGNYKLANPFGIVPVFHFKFDEETDGVPNSILTDVIPLNDALNKSWADILGAQEENMRRRRFVAGMQVEMDEETGKKINPFKPDDDILFADDAETKFGEFTDAKLTEMIAVKQEAIKDIALVSGIPPSYFNLDEAGQAISGEALRKIEARFTSLVQDSQRSYGEAWSELMSFALLLENVTNAPQEIETAWTDAAPVSESEVLDNAIKKKTLGWSVEQIQRDFGLTDQQIAAMNQEIQKREQAAIDMQTKAFDAGQSIGE